jgi:predicted transcriptional regulator
MPLLKAPQKQPKTTGLQVRIEDEVKLTLHKYAEFLDANPSYVVNEALKHLFRKDDEFKRWMDNNTEKLPVPSSSNGTPKETAKIA